jgi:predicted nucleic acid-binding protein
LCRPAFAWASRLEQHTTYDAGCKEHSFYLALAERLGASLWSADQRLVNRAHQLGADWVHWIGEA